MAAFLRLLWLSPRNSLHLAQSILYERLVSKNCSEVFLGVGGVGTHAPGHGLGGGKIAASRLTGCSRLLFALGRLAHLAPGGGGRRQAGSLAFTLSPVPCPLSSLCTRLPSWRWYNSRRQQEIEEVAAWLVPCPITGSLSGSGRRMPPVGARCEPGACLLDWCYCQAPLAPSWKSRQLLEAVQGHWGGKHLQVWGTPLEVCSWALTHPGSFLKQFHVC